MSDDIAIVGMACVFPQAGSLDEYWANLVAGMDAITDIPADRFLGGRNHEMPPDHEAAILCRRGGFIPASFRFDPMLYGVMPKAVRNGDPDPFLMLHLVDRALDDAGLPAGDPRRRGTDLIIGRGGYPTAKLREIGMRAETIDTFLELIDRRFPEVFGSVPRETIEAYLRETISPNDPDTIATSIPNLVAGISANRLDLYGAAYTIDAACASSLIAVDHAVSRLRQRRTDVAVVAGEFLNQGPTFWHVFTQLRAISPTGVLRAFDRRADGLVIGEGGGAVVLKRLEDARRDGDRVYAIVKGVGVGSDGRNTGPLAPSSVGQVKTLERAYADAQIDPATIGYLELHGTGTVLGDVTEIISVKTFFGTSPQPATGRAMGTVKSMIGHLMPAAGMAALIKTALSLAHKTLIPSLHCEEPHPEVADASFYMASETRPWIHDPARGPRRAGVNTFGFGGINAHVILEEVPEEARVSPLPLGEGQGVRARCGTSDAALSPGGQSPFSPPESAESEKTQPAKMGTVPFAPLRRPARPAIHRPNELCVFTARSTQELAGRLRRLAEFLDRDGTGATLVDVAAALAGEADFSQPCKLAIIAGDLAGLRADLGRCAEHLSEQAGTLALRAENVYFSSEASVPPGKIAVVFPGMEYAALREETAGRLLDLCLHFPAVQKVFDAFEHRDHHPEDTVPTSAIISPPARVPEEFKRRLRERLATGLGGKTAGEERPDQRNLTAMMTNLANWAGWQLLDLVDLPVDMFIGQSFGEAAALAAAGASDFVETAPMFWKMLEVSSSVVCEGQMAIALTSAETLAPILAENPGAHVAIYLAPEMVVFGGEKEPVRRVAQRLHADGVMVQLMPYPPIHTPALGPLREKMFKLSRTQDFGLRATRVPVYSSILADRYPQEPAAVVETMTLNLDHPLRVWQTLRKVYDDGARVFVQVCGGDVVSLLPAVVPDQAELVTAALDFSSCDPLTQWHHVCATLFTAGVRLRLAALYEDYAIRPLDLDAPQPAAAPSRVAMALRMDWSPLTHPCVPPRRARSISVPACAEASGDACSTGGVQSRFPVLGEIVRCVPGEELTIRRTLDLAEDLYLKDHLFIHAPGVKPVEECLPILPMTFSIEFMSEAAGLLVPDLQVIGLEDIRASRWIGLENVSSLDLQIDAKALPDEGEPGVRRVRVTIASGGKQNASAIVLLAAEYREDVQFEMPDYRGDGPWPLTAADVYDRRRMFHGPSFHTIAALDTLGDPVCSGQMQVLPRDGLLVSNPDPLLVTDPCVLDGVGQLFGLWCQMYDLYALPSHVDKVELYRGPPPPGARLPVRVEIVDVNLDTRQVRCNMEIEDGEGYLWARVQGWTDWVFKCPSHVVDCILSPAEYTVADEIALPGLPEGSVCTLFTTANLQGIAGTGSLEKSFLQTVEIEELDRITDAPQRRQVLCSRIAVKDAARLWYTRTYGGPFGHPAAFVLRHDAEGRPFFSPLPLGATTDVVPEGEGQRDEQPPCVSLSHTEGAAVALASAEPVGVDMEALGRVSPELLAEFATAQEIAAVQRMTESHGDQAWETRLWCAKEAAAKLAGTGLQNRPAKFQAVDIEASGRFLMLDVSTAQRRWVTTSTIDRFVIACAFASQSASVTTSNLPSPAGGRGEIAKQPP